MRRTITTNLYAFNVASASGPAKRLEAPRGLARELFNYETGGQKEKAAELFQATFANIVVAHTGQASQLFRVATGRNAQFLATVARSGLAEVILSGTYLTPRSR